MGDGHKEHKQDIKVVEKHMHRWRGGEVKEPEVACNKQME